MTDDDLIQAIDDWLDSQGEDVDPQKAVVVEGVKGIVNNESASAEMLDAVEQYFWNTDPQRMVCEI